MIDFDFKDFSYNPTTLGDLVNPKKARIRVASMQDLVGYIKVGKNLLVREADTSFWELHKDDNGAYIERVVGEQYVENSKS